MKKKKRIAQVEIILFRRQKNGLEFLLLKRIPEKGGFWQPVTGGMEEGETAEEAAIREVYEETHIKVKSIINNVYQFNLTGPGRKIRPEYVFGAEISGRFDLTKNVYPEHEEARFYTYEDALKVLRWDSNKEALRRLNEILIRGEDI